MTPERLLSTTLPFPYSYSQKVFEATKTIFNLVTCDNELEYKFAKFLEGSEDVAAFAKLSEQFSFSIEYPDSLSNLRYYYPDFVIKLNDGTHWLVETKGREDIDVKRKDDAAQRWCNNATILTGATWRYLKVPQNEFEKLHPTSFDELTSGLIIHS